jgi:hypothetical protein
VHAAFQSIPGSLNLCKISYPCPRYYSIRHQDSSKIEMGILILSRLHSSAASLRSTTDRLSRSWLRIIPSFDGSMVGSVDEVQHPGYPHQYYTSISYSAFAPVRAATVPWHFSALTLLAMSWILQPAHGSSAPHVALLISKYYVHPGSRR